MALSGASSAPETAPPTVPADFFSASGTRPACFPAAPRGPHGQKRNLHGLECRVLTWFSRRLDLSRRRTSAEPPPLVACRPERPPVKSAPGAFPARNSRFKTTAQPVGWYWLWAVRDLGSARVRCSPRARGGALHGKGEDSTRFSAESPLYSMSCLPRSWKVAGQRLIFAGVSPPSTP